MVEVAGGLRVQIPRMATNSSMGWLANWAICPLASSAQSYASLCIFFASKVVESYGKEEVMLWKAAISWPILRCISRVVATKVLSLDGASTDAQRPS